MAWTNEQLKAINESGTNIIVSAGAGSGKTAVLTTRVIEKLKKGIHINELLILTFTNAAAKEMKERIKKNIKKENLLEELNLLDSAYITTFDSFALSIVKKYHYILNIPKEIGITDNTILALQKSKILTDIFDNYYNDENNDSWKNFIKAFCTKDDEDLKKEILNLANSLEIRTDLNEYLDNYKENYTETKIEELIKAYFNLLKEKIDELFTEIKLQSSFFESSYEEKLIESLRNLKEEDNLDSLIAKISCAKLPITPRGSEEVTKLAKEKVNKVLKELKEMANFGNVSILKSDYLETKNYLQMIIEILKKYFKKLNAWKDKMNAYDFTDIAHLSLKIVKEQENIRNSLKLSFKEIMVDEYQDTSDTQEEFISLIENQNVYMVGDIKQSIYRFRNANPYIFKTKYDNYSKNENGIKIDLLKNFRSRKEVLENINTIFNPIMTNKIGNADYIESHQMVFGNMSYIEKGNTKENYNMEILEYPHANKEFQKEEIEIFTIAKDILNKVKNNYPVYNKDTEEIHPATWSDFVIIMDRNSTFDLTKKIFEYFKIPLSMYKDEELNESMDLYILKNLITLLLSIKEHKKNNEFKYAFTSIARSYLYNISDEEIFDYLENQNYEESQIIKDLKPLINIFNSSSTKEIIEGILENTKFYEKIITKGDVFESTIRMEELLKLAKNLGSLNYNIYDFQDYLKKLIEENQTIKFNLGNNDTNAVKIMNIHKSKGLEFNICYFCGLYKTFSKEDLKGNIIYEKSMPIYTPNLLEGKKETFLKLLIKDKIKKEDISEKIRLFYVALTRAKEKMILLLPEKENLEELKDEYGNIEESIRYKYNSIASMLYSIPYTLKRYTKKIKIEDLNLTKDYMLQKEIVLNKESTSNDLKVSEIHIKEETKNNQSFSKKITNIISKEEKKNLEFGTMVHNTLEYIDLKNFKKEEIENKFIGNLIENMLQDELFKNIKEANIYQEYEFIYQVDNLEYHGIIDLMLEYNNHIDIIDYKLNDITDENYVKQLNGYKNYIETKTNKPVNIYLFSILSETVKKI